MGLALNSRTASCRKNPVTTIDRLPCNCQPRVTTKPARPFLVCHGNLTGCVTGHDFGGMQIIFMCKTHFNAVPTQTRDGWKQYRGSRTFPETKIAVECRPGPNRGNGATSSEMDPGYTIAAEEDKSNRGLKSSMWPGKLYSALYQVGYVYVSCAMMPQLPHVSPSSDG